MWVWKSAMRFIRFQGIDSLMMSCNSILWIGGWKLMILVLLGWIVGVAVRLVMKVIVRMMMIIMVLIVRLPHLILVLNSRHRLRTSTNLILFHGLC